MAEKGKQIKHTPEQKRAIVEQVSNLYASQQCTIASCCEASGISERAFYLWLTENAELAEIYKKARTKSEEIFWEKLRPIANSAMQRLLEGEEYEEVVEADTVFQGVPTGFKAQTFKRGKVLPNPTVTIFAHKGLNPEKFADRSIVDLKTETGVTHTLTPEIIERIDALVSGSGKADNGQIPVSSKQKR